MTSAAPDVDAQKQRYANELAAYTLRQWETARRSLELNQYAPNGSEPARTPNNRSNSSSQNGHGPQGIQSRDYAQRSHRHGGGIVPENRAFAA